MVGIQEILEIQEVNVVDRLVANKCWVLGRNTFIER